MFVNRTSSLVVLTLSSLIAIASCSTKNTPIYSLTTSSEPSEGGVVSPSSGEYDEGEQVQLMATAADGWVFAGWGGDLEGAENPQAITVDADKDVTALFERRDYPLTITIEGEGTVAEEVVQAKSTDYPFETTVQLTATAADGWVFAGWGGDLEGTENPQTIGVDSDKNVTAGFTKLEMIINAGDGQSATVGTAVETPPSVLVTDANDNPAAGVEITFAAATGGGTVDPASAVTTDADGIAAVSSWTLGATAGTNTLTANGSGLTEVTFTATAPDFYLSENGVTILCPDAEINSKGVVGGKEYTKRKGEDINTDNAASTCTSGITNMDFMFRGATAFNQDIGGWDVSSVTNMQGMFAFATAFNADIGDWNVSGVTDMRVMFSEATDFNVDISSWDVSGVTDMGGMLFGASAFNGDIGDWDVSGVTRMDFMFERASNFNGDISGWNVSNVTSMRSMFYEASAFNQNISEWCVADIENEPFNFSTASSLDAGNKPNWGKPCSE